MEYMYLCNVCAYCMYYMHYTYILRVYTACLLLCKWLAVHACVWQSLSLRDA